VSELERVRLTRSRHLWQRKRGHRTGTDDVLCAWAAARARPEARRALELGAGQGAVSLILTEVLPDLHVTAIEAQVISFELLERNVRENDLGDRYDLHCGDLRRLPIAEGAFELAFGTPPFMPMGSGTLPQDAQRAAARFEMRGGVEAYCQAAARALVSGGVLVLVMDAAQPERHERALEDSGLVLAEVTEVVPLEGRPPTYLLYRATKGEGSPVDVLRKSLAVRDEHERFSPDFAEIRAALSLPAEREIWL
jgi:tRNA1(Val) A37 N6-methylase TrmN6